MSENATLYSYGVPVSNQNNSASDMLVNIEGMSATNVESAISEINTNLSNLPYKSISNNYVEITSYTTTSNAYTLPSNGYVIYYVSNASTSSLCTLNVQMANGAWINFGRALGNEKDGVKVPVYMAKGTKVYITGTNAKALFFPTV